MKLKTRLILVLMIGVALIYTACKKSSSSQTLSTKTVSSQIALNLAQTLYGGFGGFNITSGLNAPGTFGVDRNKIRLNMTKGRLGVNSFGDITCGLHADTTFNTSVTVNGMQATVAGTIGFTFNCSSGTPSGFTVTDNLKIAEASAQVTGTYNINENLSIALVNPQDSTSNVALNGTASMSDNLKTNGKTTTESYNYTFNQVIIDQEGTIVSGSATFATKGTNASGSWDYSGTVVFLGNGMAKITINGTVYNVNLQTGAVS
ncbi:MAG: hypothetical protein JWR54_3872 [Mucilaginibacter sp.]|nr:hypothetical protein [Mucilaginibacter sp.]